ncbi:chromate efflux transporter [Marinomonas sp. 15G1-11]|uniref:Chromate efflux transporter n=1 Tax=Marinomonas phaeophyticola TaxID=3004091 RepID=A0ABT4JYT7_9GAMM|nr:chromate efflux transporter [Marinomonas sp. 15G1-11]MCZ2723565.1 chromate efflux transporter [Marinomonas sp. 15G1-11]
MTLILEVFTRFFILGCTSFGGPAAHLGYFHKEFVENRQWLSKESYAQFVMLSQVMPGPGSSQVGFAIGYHRAGWCGAMAAFIGFTLPSVCLMLLLVWGNINLQTNAFLAFWMHALTMLATVVVADACYSMWKQFCKDMTTRIIAMVSVVFLTVWSFGYGAVILLFIMGIVGSLLPVQGKQVAAERLEVRFANVSGLLAIVLFLLSFVSFSSLILTVFFDYYQAGSLVFGGGHVILPLLQNALDQFPEDIILAAYALAQSVPGPMFTVATFLGGITGAESGGVSSLVILGGIATIGVFLPGLLLMMFAVHHWKRLATVPRVNAAIVALNATVVGLLIYVFASVVLPHSILGPLDAIVMLAGGGWLFYKRPSVLLLLLVFSTIAWIRYLVA